MNAFKPLLKTIFAGFINCFISNFGLVPLLINFIIFGFLLFNFAHSPEVNHTLY